LKNSGLYVILDRAIAGDRDLADIAEDIIDGGADLIQLRDKVSSDSKFLKTAKSLRKITRKRRVLLIINDRADIAIASDSDGLHIGGDDLPLAEARRLIGKDKIIGISTHSLQEALLAQENGADYIGVGPIFKTASKPDLKPIGPDIVSQISAHIDIPAFFIGGIDLNNLDEITGRGGKSIAVASAILNMTDISKTVRTFKETLLNTKVTA